MKPPECESWPKGLGEGGRAAKLEFARGGGGGDETGMETTPGPWR